MARNYRQYCSVYGCLNSTISKPEMIFFRLPTQAARLSQWLQLIQRDDLENKPNITVYRICETHFNIQDILPTPNRKLLKKNALPSLNLPDLQNTVQECSRKEDKETQTKNTMKESHTQTAMALSCNTPRERKLKKELLACRKKLKLHETENKTHKAEESTFHKLCDKFLTKELALLVEAQTNLKFHGKGNRYSKDFIKFCSSLYFTSPQAYRFLQSALCLPCTTTLYKHSSATEINERAIYMEKYDRNYNVCVANVQKPLWLIKPRF